jgi:probable FeS assembly SUF system protein SufT
MWSQKETTTTRDIEASEIPAGTKFTIPAGTRLQITQSLGGSYTVMVPMGYLARIDGKDADAIGEEVASKAVGDTGPAKPVEELCWDQLRTCYDPEIPVNIVDLGLVYGSEVTELPAGGNKVSVRFSLTAPGCGMGDVLKADIQGKMASLPGVTETDVDVALDPPWDQSRMSDAARLQLGLM